MSEDAEKTYNDFTKKGYTDGLPIVPPTEARVARMLEWTDRKKDDVLGTVPPADAEATVEHVAINAVMAGCKPEYFPVVVTEIETLLNRPNLRGAVATTGNVWPFAVANGPIAKEIGMYSGWGLLGTGPNHQANLTIGRTMTLIIQNIGNSIPGISEKKPLYNISRFGMCIAEDEDNLPKSWEPLHVEKGFKKDTSTVTVFDEATWGAIGAGGGRASGVLQIDMLNEAKRLAQLHYNPPLGLTPLGNVSLYICTSISAKIYADNGWTKQRFKEFMYENCRVDPRDWYSDYPPDVREDVLRTVFGSVPHSDWMRWSSSLPLFRTPEDIWIVVAGGNVARSVWSVSSHHTDHPGIIKQIALADGTPAKSVKDFKKKR